ncbi:MAG: phosphoenolpyruvate--protein phosphotransferase [Ktedonobacteraceae bacterium]|nr:phosphoenolpyruvate--protein phosphotransferase [Ktedonobacteraceae bacterium]
MPTKAIRGIAASPGIAIGPILRYEAAKLVANQHYTSDIPHELLHLEEALTQARQEIHGFYEQAKQTIGTQEGAIFEAHEAFLNDPALLEQVHTAIQQQSSSAAFAWQEGIERYANQLRLLHDEYLAARATDLEDVGQRVLRILQGGQEQALRLTEPTIIVATDLTPSETVRFDTQMVCAFCTATGTPTSHAAILAKALGIPAITGLGSDLAQLADGLQVIVDGNTGEILLAPDAETLERYRLHAQIQTQKQRIALEASHQPAFTLDGKHVEIVANINSPDQVAEALTYGAEGVGLLRTEFLFLERATAPTEEEQFGIYRAILTGMHQQPVVVRTFDIGGDKPAPYMPVAEEMNPFLGVRGIRLALTQKELLQTQLRALLRAGVGQQLRIMFPMVSSSEEIDVLREHLMEARKTLEERQIAAAANVQIGIMIEVPAAALMADVLAEQVDFFSIGTNDLTQYTLAADRTNEAIAPFADALHPAVLRLIDSVCKAAHARQRWVGLCGELGGDPLALPVLLGLGLDELSMAPKAIPLCKQQVRLYSQEQAHEIAQQALKKRNAAEVRAYLKACSHTIGDH